MNGSFALGTSITANFVDSVGGNSPYPTGTINLTLDTNLYNRGADINRMVGSWSGPYRFTGDLSLVISSDGSFTGFDNDLGGSCSFNGTVAIPDATINVYEVTMNSEHRVAPLCLPALILALPGQKA